MRARAPAGAPLVRRSGGEAGVTSTHALARSRSASRSRSAPASSVAVPRGQAAGSSAPGVTKTSITFGTHQPLTGPAAPGYSEIAPASQAFFDYVNAHGGVFGRKIHLIIKDDAYNPTNTVNVVHQLVLQDKVFGIFEGLGTPTHTKVVGYLNASKVPDLFVASGCPCWDNGSSQPETFGWQPNYTIEGKILGQYLKQHFPGQKVGVLYQDDDFGQGGLAGIRAELPAADIVAKQPYQSGTTTLAPQVTAIKAVGGKGARRLHRPDLHRDRPADVVHARLQAAAGRLERGHRSDHRRRAAQDGLQGQGLGDRADRGRNHRRLPAVPERHSNPWIQLFQKIHAQYDSSAPFDGNVEYGMANAYTLVQALQAAGKNLTRQALVNAVENAGAGWKGPGLVPFRYSKTQHGGYGGAAMAQIKGGKIVAHRAAR